MKCPTCGRGKDPKPPEPPIPCARCGRPTTNAVYCSLECAKVPRPTERDLLVVRLREDGLTFKQIGARIERTATTARLIYVGHLSRQRRGAMP